jgi:hypothetical protein
MSTTDSLSLRRAQVLHQQAVKDARPRVLCKKNNTLMLESVYCISVDPAGGPIIGARCMLTRWHVNNNQIQYTSPNHPTVAHVAQKLPYPGWVIYRGPLHTTESPLLLIIAKCMLIARIHLRIAGTALMDDATPIQSEHAGNCRAREINVSIRGRGTV